jgi:hypothetical protein
MAVVPPPLPPIAAADEPAPAPLWRELVDGTAGWGVRLLVTLALAAAMGGMVPILAYFLAALNRDWRYSYSGNSVYPRDELLVFLAVVAAGGFLAASAWLWSRTGRRRAVFMPVVLTIAVAFVTVVLAVVADDNLRGASELVVGGLIALGGASLILIWVQAFRRRGPRWRPLRDRGDGLPDVRCPSCNYRMVGLTESRCPECGTAYTLDELIARQGFAPVSPKPPAPPDVAANVHAALESA